MEVRPAPAGARRPVVEHRKAAGDGEIRRRRPALQPPVRPVVAQVHRQRARGVKETQGLEAREDQELVESPDPRPVRPRLGRAHAGRRRRHARSPRGRCPGTAEHDRPPHVGELDHPFRLVRHELVDRSLAAPVRLRVVVVVHHEVGPGGEPRIEERQGAQGRPLEVHVEQHEGEALLLQPGEGLGDAAGPRLDVGRVPDVAQHHLQGGVPEAEILADARVEVVRVESGEGVEEIVPALRRDTVDEAARPPSVDAGLGQRAGNPVRVDAREGHGDRRIAVIVPVVEDVLVGGGVEGRHLHAALSRPAPSGDVARRRCAGGSAPGTSDATSRAAAAG